MKTATAILFAGFTVTSYALWRNMTKKQDVQYIIQPAAQQAAQPSTSDAIKGAFLEWGLNTLFSGIGAKKTSTGGQGGAIIPASYTGGNSGAYEVDKAPTGGNPISFLLDLIGGAEADPSAGYDSISHLVKKHRHPSRPITQMTVGEVLDWQESIDPYQNSEAVGRYQIMEDTLRGLVNQGHASLHEPFSPATQDRLAVVLAERRGLNSYRNGSMSLETFGNNLAKEWAGLPVLTGSKAGKSYYDKYNTNSATVDTSSLREALGRIL